MVFELTGSLITFSRAVALVPGLTLFGEDEGEFDESEGEEDAGAFYLGVPDVAALSQILALWDRYRSKRPLGQFQVWEKVFECLHDLRRWGPRDRMHEVDAALLLDQIGQEPVRLELELVYYRTAAARLAAKEAVKARVQQLGGRTITERAIDEIAYDAVLVEVPAVEARATAERQENSLAFQSDVLSIRPQSIFQPMGVELEAPAIRGEPLPALPPILTILDAVPLTNHPLLAGRVELVDPADLSSLSVGERVHGTAMSSLVVWGDLSDEGAPLSRIVVVRPVTYAPPEGHERFPNDSLVVDDVVVAVRGLFEGEGGGAAPSTLIVNISLGDTNRPFYGRMSPWARALDWLAHQYKVLFVVSAGNLPTLMLPAVDGPEAYLALTGIDRVRAGLAAISASKAHRRLIAPAEAVNAVTIGALHHDAMVHPADYGRNNHDPYPDRTLPSVVSRLGPGFRNSVKPEILAPGGRLRGSSHPINKPAALTFNGPTKFGGLKVAGPQTGSTAWSGATSGAAALASRAGHRIHDALADAYGEQFLGLTREQKSLILKALLVHRAQIPSADRALVEEVFGPEGTYLWQQRQNNLRRLFGFGVPDWEEALACLGSRATLWGYGSLGANDARAFQVPLPIGVFGNRSVRRVSATVSWYSPILPGRRSYKAVRLSLEDDADGQDILGVGPQSGQAGKMTTARGTIFNRCWEGKKLRDAVEDSTFEIRVVRQPDPVQELDDAVAFGLAVTLETDDGEINVYEAVRDRLAVKPRVPVLVGA